MLVLVLAGCGYSMTAVACVTWIGMASMDTAHVFRSCVQSVQSPTTSSLVVLAFTWFLSQALAYLQIKVILATIIKRQVVNVSVSDTTVHVLLLHRMVNAPVFLVPCVFCCSAVVLQCLESF